MRFSACFAILLVCGAFRPAIAEDTVAADISAVEAAFLFNFAIYTEWPVLPADEFRICVLGSDPVLAALVSIKRKIKDRQVNVTNITSATQAQTCQVLFVGKSEHGTINDLARQIGKTPVMVVSEANGYDPRNVTVELFTQQDRIAFRINHTAAQENSLTVSSKLLKLAQQVY